MIPASITRDSEINSASEMKGFSMKALYLRNQARRWVLVYFFPAF